jgi:histidyl-tRNA synthetase
MTVKGTRLLYGVDAQEYTETIDQLRAIAELMGCEEVIISSLAHQQTFVDKAGPEILKQMYTFDDKGGRGLCLIPEATAIVQEWYKAHHKELKKPTKIFYVNRCYRYEQPQSGRYREFTQFGVEILGDTSGQDYDDCLDILLRCMEHFQINYNCNKLVKRGLSYYIEDGFEVECSYLGAQKQVAGGGRYDVGIGFGIGVERLILAKNLSE